MHFLEGHSSIGSSDKVSEGTRFSTSCSSSMSSSLPIPAPYQEYGNIYILHNFHSSVHPNWALLREKLIEDDTNLIENGRVL